MNPLLIIFVAAAAASGLSWPPEGNMDAQSSPQLLLPTETLLDGVEIAKTAPLIDLRYYDCQTYEPKPGVWSHWGDGSVTGDVYYSAIGDHSSPSGNAFVYAYDAASKELRKLVDLKSILKQPEGRYSPGKIHSEINLGSDGWLYFSTHRGSTKIAFHETANFQGDWILRHHPKSGKSEILAHAPLPMQCMPCGTLDPERLIFYAGTADGLNEKQPQFLAYDLKKREILFSSEQGPARAMIRSRSGLIYFHAQKSGPAPLLRFDPDSPGDGLVPTSASVGLRAATGETSKGRVYTADGGELWEFQTNRETARKLGSLAVGAKDYITSLDLDPKTERYLYYVPGSHGGAEKDGSPLVQFDLKTGTRKVIAFLHPFVYERIGFVPMGSYSLAVSEAGDKVFITWNGNRGASPDQIAGNAKPRIKFNTCALTVVHIPASERLDAD